MAPNSSAFKLSLWWALNRDRAFVVLGLVFGTLGALGAAFIVIWSRGGDVVTGKVIGFGTTESEAVGSFPVAVVELGKFQTNVVLARDHNCQIGDAIKLRKRNVGLTSFYGRPCSAPPKAAVNFS